MERFPIRDMPYRRRYQGMFILEYMYYLKCVESITAMLTICLALAGAGIDVDALMLVIIPLIIYTIRQKIIPWVPVPPVDPANRDRLIDSFSDEDAYNCLRFRKTQLRTLFEEMGLPNGYLTCSNGTSCPWEHGMLMLLYRIHNPTQLNKLQRLQSMFTNN